jgi:hypothetical protein
MRSQSKKLARPCLTTPLPYLTVGGISTPSEFLKSDPLTTEPWKTVINDNVPRGSIDMPLLITHGTADPLIPIEGSMAEAVRRCSEGKNVTFMRFTDVERPGSDVTAIGWIEDRFAGGPTGSTCRIR